MSYEYSIFQPFVGFFSYEHEGEIKAFGSIEDDCHNTPSADSLPFGLVDMNVASEEELHGKVVTQAVIWENNDNGEAAAIEEEVLENIEAAEKKIDSAIYEMPEEDRQENTDFDTGKVNLDVAPSEPVK